MSNPNPTPMLVNLKPFKKGQSGNPKGRPKGSFNMSTLIKEMLDDPKLAEMVVFKQRPYWWDGLSEKRFAEAVIMAQIIKALNGDTKAFTALRVAAFGDRLAVQGGDQPQKVMSIVDLGGLKASNEVG